ncbi:prepilin-type N-terminal cleavage/methylation domain-containing protein [Motilibacter rhizosphaerae]|uniref:Prepilin-type N-terminal cleavage/methylation domain-containing protein n=1 Tax=Motilibacter rhizosphaerae TaxID=598652 RepID=A0A4V2F4I3_9ACTN|nr:carboxypeptidase regulatory-like domain-containing protein [Motilibacter rhizosphaerae]RZS89419.1 prepilin-type N-terminal cleavage/methylation domain-containing protein [Motilibacter rhizosphaerae]
MHRLRADRGDEGFTLIEIVVSMVVFALFATGILGALVTIVRTQRTNSARVVAAQLASSAIELARGTSAVKIPLGTSTPGLPVPAGFSVQQDAALVPFNATGSACMATGGKLTYVRVTETVTWSGMGTTAPVRSDTLVALPITGLDPTKGTLGIPVQDATSAPVAGATVTITGGASVVTGADGCALFTGLTPGTYTGTVSKAGYVDTLGNLSATSTSTSVTAAALTVASPVSYAAAGMLTVGYAAPAGYAIPGSLPLTVAGTSSSYPARTFYACGTPQATASFCASTGQAPRLVGSVSNSDPSRNGLFPTGTSGSYLTYAGDCADNALPTPVAATLAPAGSTAVSVPLGGVAVTVRRAGVGTAGVTLRAVHQVSAGCSLVTTVPLGVSGSGGAAPVALPYGRWTIQALDSLLTVLGSADVTVDATVKTATVNA